MDVTRLQHSPALRSPLRNVLQELSPNAKSPLSRVANVSDGSLKPSLKPALNLADFPVKPLLPSMMGDGKPRTVLAAPSLSLLTARKRSFAEVDASERVGSKRVSPASATPTVPNTQEDEEDTNRANGNSTMNYAPQPDSAANASQELPNTQQTMSFSSLIDFNPQSDLTSGTDASTSSQEEPGSAPSSSRAETLRLRLKFALYKVRTDQTNVPFNALELSTRDASRNASKPNNSSTTSPPAPSTTTTAESDPSEPTPSAPRPLAMDATAVPKLLPAPVLVPTAYSSRHIYAPHYHADRTPASSPPRRSAMLSPELSLPTCSPLKTPAKAVLDMDDVELTSSAVKGRAASGLLELRGCGAAEVG